MTDIALDDWVAKLATELGVTDLDLDIDQVLDLADQMGAGALAERTLSELRATGARPRRAALSGLESLTPAERRVAQLAARGLTNREVAQELFVTQKTVQTHLSSVYRKLDVGSRRQLPELFNDPGR